MAWKLWRAGCLAPDADMPAPFPARFQFAAAAPGYQVEMGFPREMQGACRDAGTDWHAYVTSPEVRAKGDAYLFGNDPSTARTQRRMAGTCAETAAAGGAAVALHAAHPVDPDEPPTGGVQAEFREAPRRTPPGRGADHPDDPVN